MCCVVGSSDQVFIEDACGEVTGHPALILDVLVGWLVGPWGKVGLRQVRARTWSVVVVLGEFSARWGVVWCHFGAPRRSFAHLCGSKVATTRLDVGKCGRVVPMDVLEHRKHT